MIQRDFIIGSKWIYYKVYIGSSEANMLLIELEKVVKQLYDKELIEIFFFIRYKDPEFHLRLRFKLKDTQDISQIILAVYPLLAKFHEGFKIHNVQLDTYKQEIERYGQDKIELSEQLFFIDSLYILRLLRLEGDLLNDESIWYKMLKTCDLYLEYFGFDLEGKYNLVKLLSKSFEREFNFNKIGKKALANKYRKNRKKIEEAMINENSQDNYLVQVKPIISQILSRVDRDSYEFNELINSYLHMSVNRAFSSSARLNEYVLYDFLTLYYKSKIARTEKYSFKQ